MTFKASQPLLQWGFTNSYTCFMHNPLPQEDRRMIICVKIKIHVFDEPIIRAYTIVLLRKANNFFMMLYSLRTWLKSHKLLKSLWNCPSIWGRVQKHIRERNWLEEEWGEKNKYMRVIEKQNLVHRAYFQLSYYGLQLKSYMVFTPVTTRLLIICSNIQKSQQSVIRIFNLMDP